MPTEYRIDTHYGSGPVRHAVDGSRLVVTWEKSGKSEEVPLSESAYAV